ncbi:hypothetical protein [Dyadobacter sediminis]|uniref:Uncharacterized protein n=1 Tax=Dyadobacter sediminis TaxID=1493691 RepID=A0A5R9KBR3_9BACT|nr:hypothetical protein [Dyadobacter sediminis]TLU92198.1 hypothetical protein FEM55_15765 [Dyadobacter sediminis]GGB96616.1 hypothetical protein GCM10011325_24930 [Dyadobacter sediminis]
MIEIKLYSKFNDLTNAYEFTAYCKEGLKAGEYFRYNGYEYLITSDPVYCSSRDSKEAAGEAVFMAVRLGTYLIT